jgi:3-methylcrotonyl-CoA carboxylase beta subunit
MGAEQAAGVLAIVQEEAARKRGQEPDRDQIALLKAMTAQKFEQESDPYYATAHIWDDGLIDPRDTRAALTIGLSMASNRDWASDGAPRYGVFRM